MDISVVLSVVIAICTALYTVINLMMWFESRATRKQKITPFIVAYLQSTDSHMVEVLHIKNIGEGYAKDVWFKVIKDYKRLGKESLLLSECGAIKRGVSSFPPQYEVTYYIESWGDIGEKNIDEIIELEISYKRMDGKEITNKYALPLNELTDQNYSNPPETFIGQIPHYLQEINKTLKSDLKKA
ncbi:hypothetical protein [Gabonibacter massiliensis]|uniref:hypothetical protein n=1 Tax=Gabonibacter massiliensis TaxID=1720195 RepID=UPI00073EED76|nr:hypothetical protein [Gabonibacter massiliensis]